MMILSKKKKITEINDREENIIESKTEEHRKDKEVIYEQIHSTPKKYVPQYLSISGNKQSLIKWLSTLLKIDSLNQNEFKQKWYINFFKILLYNETMSRDMKITLMFCEGHKGIESGIHDTLHGIQNILERKVDCQNLYYQNIVISMCLLFHYFANSKGSLFNKLKSLEEAMEDTGKLGTTDVKKSSRINSNSSHMKAQEFQNSKKRSLSEKTDDSIEEVEEDKSTKKSIQYLKNIMENKGDSKNGTSNSTLYKYYYIIEFMNLLANEKNKFANLEMFYHITVFILHKYWSTSPLADYNVFLWFLEYIKNKLETKKAVSKINEYLEIFVNLHPKIFNISNAKKRRKKSSGKTHIIGAAEGTTYFEGVLDYPYVKNRIRQVGGGFPDLSDVKKKNDPNTGLFSGFSNINNMNNMGNNMNNNMNNNRNIFGGFQNTGPTLFGKSTMDTNQNTGMDSGTNPFSSGNSPFKNFDGSKNLFGTKTAETSTGGGGSLFGGKINMGNTNTLGNQVNNPFNTTSNQNQGNVFMNIGNNANNNMGSSNALLNNTGGTTSGLFNSNMRTQTVNMNSNSTTNANTSNNARNTFNLSMTSGTNLQGMHSGTTSNLFNKGGINNNMGIQQNIQPEMNMNFMSNTTQNNNANLNMSSSVNNFLHPNNNETKNLFASTNNNNNNNTINPTGTTNTPNTNAQSNLFSFGNNTSPLFGNNNTNEKNIIGFKNQTTNLGNNQMNITSHNMGTSVQNNLFNNSNSSETNIFGSVKNNESLFNKTANVTSNVFGNQTTTTAPTSFGKTSNQFTSSINNTNNKSSISDYDPNSIFNQMNQLQNDKQLATLFSSDKGTKDLFKDIKLNNQPVESKFSVNKKPLFSSRAVTKQGSHSTPTLPEGNNLFNPSLMNKENSLLNTVEKPPKVIFGKHNVGSSEGSNNLFSTPNTNSNLSVDTSKNIFGNVSNMMNPTSASSFVFNAGSNNTSNNMTSFGSGMFCNSGDLNRSEVNSVQNLSIPVKKLTLEERKKKTKNNMLFLFSADSSQTASNNASGSIGTTPNLMNINSTPNMSSLNINSGNSESKPLFGFGKKNDEKKTHDSKIIFGVGNDNTSSMENKNNEKAEEQRKEKEPEESNSGPSKKFHFGSPFEASVKESENKDNQDKEKANNISGMSKIVDLTKGNREDESKNNKEELLSKKTEEEDMKKIFSLGESTTVNKEKQEDAKGDTKKVKPSIFEIKEETKSFIFETKEDSKPSLFGTSNNTEKQSSFFDISKEENSQKTNITIDDQNNLNDESSNKNENGDKKKLNYDLIHKRGRRKLNDSEDEKEKDKNDPFETNQKKSKVCIGFENKDTNNTLKDHASFTNINEKETKEKAPLNKLKENLQNSHNVLNELSNSYVMTSQNKMFDPITKNNESMININKFPRNEKELIVLNNNTNENEETEKQKEERLRTADSISNITRTLFDSRHKVVCLENEPQRKEEIDISVGMQVQKRPTNYIGIDVVENDETPKSSQIKEGQCSEGNSLSHLGILKTDDTKDTKEETKKQENEEAEIKARIKRKRGQEYESETGCDNICVKRNALTPQVQPPLPLGEKPQNIEEHKQSEGTEREMDAEDEVVQTKETLILKSQKMLLHKEDLSRIVEYKKNIAFDNICVDLDGDMLDIQDIKIKLLLCVLNFHFKFWAEKVILFYPHNQVIEKFCNELIKLKTTFDETRNFGIFEKIQKISKKLLRSLDKKCCIYESVVFLACEKMNVLRYAKLSFFDVFYIYHFWYLRNNGNIKKNLQTFLYTNKIYPFFLNFHMNLYKEHNSTKVKTDLWEYEDMQRGIGLMKGERKNKTQNTKFIGDFVTLANKIKQKNSKYEEEEIGFMGIAYEDKIEEEDESNILVDKDIDYDELSDSEADEEREIDTRKDEDEEREEEKEDSQMNNLENVLNSDSSIGSDIFEKSEENDNFIGNIRKEYLCSMKTKTQKNKLSLPSFIRIKKLTACECILFELLLKKNILKVLKKYKFLKSSKYHFLYANLISMLKYYNYFEKRETTNVKEKSQSLGDSVQSRKSENDMELDNMNSKYEKVLFLKKLGDKNLIYYLNVQLKNIENLFKYNEIEVGCVYLNHIKNNLYVMFQMPLLIYNSLYSRIVKNFNDFILLDNFFNNSCLYHDFRYEHMLKSKIAYMFVKKFYVENDIENAMKFALYFEYNRTKVQKKLMYNDYIFHKNLIKAYVDVHESVLPKNWISLKKEKTTFQMNDSEYLDYYTFFFKDISRHIKFSVIEQIIQWNIFSVCNDEEDTRRTDKGSSESPEGKEEFLSYFRYMVRKSLLDDLVLLYTTRGEYFYKQVLAFFTNKNIVTDCSMNHNPHFFLLKLMSEINQIMKKSFGYYLSVIKRRELYYTGEASQEKEILNELKQQYNNKTENIEYVIKMILDIAEKIESNTLKGVNLYVIINLRNVIIDLFYLFKYVIEKQEYSMDAIEKLHKYIIYLSDLIYIQSSDESYIFPKEQIKDLYLCIQQKYVNRGMIQKN